MDLLGRLSNPDFQALLQRLTRSNRHQVRVAEAEASGAAPDGRRPFGSVNQVVIKVLQLADGPMRARDIHKRVEYFLDADRVSRSSVKMSLHRGCQSKVPLFERLSRGRYSLIQ